jgi:hypothetical protein
MGGNRILNVAFTQAVKLEATKVAGITPIRL